MPSSTYTCPLLLIHALFYLYMPSSTYTCPLLLIHALSYVNRCFFHDGIHNINTITAAH
ncbi:hypothetical protein BDB01DRAFT_790501 [Pilobolus umbonatus]|nr:hypothetical protein BDB01DRAFT_790501 [Pilobolus umbonatus]